MQEGAVFGVDEKEADSYRILWGHMSTAFQETTPVQRYKKLFCLWGGQEGRRFLLLVPVAGVALGSQGDMHTNGMGSRGRRAIGPECTAESVIDNPYLSGIIFNIKLISIIFQRTYI